MCCSLQTQMLWTAHLGIRGYEQGQDAEAQLIIPETFTAARSAT